MNADVYILWGFLGSGKTTLINHLLATCLEGKKVVVVENESGVESVDSLLLKSKNYQVKELNSGCVCCTLRMELPLVIEEVKATVRPAIILIEPSGLASLEELIQIPGLKIDGIISLVDVRMYPFLKRLNPDFYRRQYRLSSVFLLTKEGEVEESQAQCVVNELLAIQPGARIILDYQSLNKDDWERVWLDSRRFGFNQCIPVCSKIVGPVYETWTILVHSPLDIYFCEALFNRINRFFSMGLVRAKGILQDAGGQWGKVDYVNEKVSFEAVPTCEQVKDNGFISIWWNKSQADCPIDWISTFMNATEVACSMDVIPIDDTELYQYLGFQGAGPDGYMLDFISRLKEEAIAICHPRFGYRLVPGEAIDKRTLKLSGLTFTPEAILVNCLQESAFFAMITASIGKELDTWIEVKRLGGDVMEAFVADALGSVIVESIVSWGLSFLTHTMGKMNIKISNAYSPGYCGWDVAEQRLFFSKLPDGFCGISLTDSCLMLPVKSVSALVGMGEKVEKKPYGCAICRKKDCFKRKEVTHSLK